MSSQPDYRNPNLAASDRVRDLLGRMTLEEKVRQMGMDRLQSFLVRGRMSRRKMSRFFGNMSIGCLQDIRTIPPERTVEAVNAAQSYLVRETRLGIPALIIGECVHGHWSEGATIFPQALALASTWDPPLIKRMAEAIAKEARAVGVTQALSPNFDLARDPRWGRVEESYSEDPWLTSRMGVAFVKGLQGEGARLGRDHLVATPKHFVAYGSLESGLNRGPTSCGERELRTMHLPPFEAAIREGGALSLMPSYGAVDGIPMHCSKFLLTDVLRKEWGFEGYVFSDYGGLPQLQGCQRVAHNNAEAGKMALEAGLDLEASSECCFGKLLLELVERGEVDAALIDQAAARILRVKFLAGIFEGPYAEAGRARRIVNNPAHRRLAREVAQESIILLKNERRLLPLTGRFRTIAVIGPNADVAQVGGYVRPKAGAVTPLQGIRSAAPKGVEVLHAHGCGIIGTRRDGFGEAVALARKSDAAIVVIGGCSQGEGQEGWGEDMRAVTCGERRDRSELGAPGAQEDLVRAIHATGTPTVVVLIHGRAYSIEWIAENIPAVVEAWYPGEQGGHALGDVLFGKVNPSGKLPVTVPRSAGHLPVFYNHLPSARGVYHRSGTAEKAGWDYVFTSTKPLFAFGHGLSYTAFKYSALKVSPSKILPGGQVAVAVDVRNAGPRAGKEVVQLYLRDSVSSVATPVAALRRFEKISLRPGEKKTVRFTLTPADLRLLDANMNWVVEPGEFEVRIGPLKKSFTVAEPARESR